MVYAKLSHGIPTKRRLIFKEIVFFILSPLSRVSSFTELHRLHSLDGLALCLPHIVTVVVKPMFNGSVQLHSASRGRGLSPPLSHPRRSSLSCHRFPFIPRPPIVQRLPTPSRLSLTHSSLCRSLPLALAHSSSIDGSVSRPWSRRDVWVNRSPHRGHLWFPGSLPVLRENRDSVVEIR